MKMPVLKKSFFRVVVVVTAVVCGCFWLLEKQIHVTTMSEESGVSTMLVNSYPKEADLMNDPPLVDALTATTAGLSKITLINSSVNFKVGDTVGVTITTYDGRGQLRTQGGDIIRLRLQGPNLSSMIGTVVDNGNGTYFGQIKLFFPGEFHIESYIAYSRDAVRTFYHMRRLGGVNHVLHGRFSNDGYSEDTPCSPTASDLGNEPICNLTQENYGLPWYCVRPKAFELVCLDWICTVEKGFTEPLTEPEIEVTNRTKLWQTIPCSISVRVTEGNQPRKWLPDCRDLPKNLLMKQTSPIGYMQNGIWSNLLCKADRTMERYNTCLKGKQLVVLGDSTSRGMVEVIHSWEHGDLLSAWPRNPWHKPIIIHKPELDLTITWRAHSVPFFTKMETRRYNRAISASLADIGDEEKAIVLISYHMHLLAFHHSIFEQRLILLRRVIEIFLQRNRHAVVFIQGMPVWMEEYFVALFPDCFADLFADITKRVFGSIPDRVIYLDHRDITIAGKNLKMHPDLKLQEELVHNMLGFIC